MSGPKTPKESGSLSRWDVHSARCLRAATLLEELAAKETSESQASASVCEVLARRARALARVFEVWSTHDPGLERRLQAIQQMYDLARECDVFDIKL